MAAHNGKWKLTKSTNVHQVYVATGQSEEQIERNAWLENPANEIILEIEIEAGKCTCALWGQRREVLNEQFTLGEERTYEHRGKKYTATTILDGNTLYDTIQGEGQKPEKHKRAVAGHKLTIEMECNGVCGSKEFEKVEVEPVLR